MKITVIIVNYNGESKLIPCIESWIADGGSESDVVVVDNGSVDKSISILENRFLSLRIIRNACNGGFAKAVNQGISQSCQDLVLILNNDAYLVPGAIRALQKCAVEHPTAALIGARLVDQNLRPQNVVAPFPNVWRDFLPRFLQRLFLPRGQIGRLEAEHEPMSVPTLIGAALMVRRSALKRLGLMDEDFFFYLEETEWCYRAHILGFDVLLCPQALVMHELGGTANRYRAASRIEFHRSRLLYARKVEGSLAWFILSIHYYFSSSINLISNALAMALTFFQVSRLRRKTRMYAVVWLWHFSGRPSGWGLPNKCPRSKND
ncbi:glycosyltransferase family 2 protein [Acidithiobacillus sp.]|uniref:glycosyltransferase family 2 protein n=1 Tax=Acidithiobacillus sp. TaxID=1872118 RepID=UPI0036055B15